jgi:uncharacterized membrane protein
VTDLEKFRLSDGDNKFLIRFSKFMQKTYLINVCIVLIFILAAIHIVLGIRFKYSVDFILAAVFAAGGIQTIIVSRKYMRLYTIITQMQEHIAKLQSEREG